MKSTLSLPIIHNNKDLPIYPPTLESDGEFFIVRFKYQSLSLECQGDWRIYKRKIKKSEYDFNAVSKEITDLVKWYYRGYYEL